ncbi:DUF3310 domain-containing protein [Streptomyces sp. NPDC094045]|uniref:DUF3310 domain-containing protein n=1 Tax=unclassified Streptomyces TaxID=2593676 RepID=UPI003393DC62
MPKFNIGDDVTVKAMDGQIAAWLHNERQGAITAIYEGTPYPYEVEFKTSGGLCFAPEELARTPEQNPGRRMLDETQGLSFGVDALEAHKVMKQAVSSTSKVVVRHDSVERPGHYTSHPSGIECIEITKHMNFALGNAVKYIWRAGLKDDAIQDLEKARQYIDIEIKRLKESAK